MELADVEAIQHVLALYGHVVDGRAWDRLDEVFTPEARFHVVNTDATMHGPEGIGQHFATIGHPLGHHITNTVIEPDADGQGRRCTASSWSSGPTGARAPVVTTTGSSAPPPVGGSTTGSPRCSRAPRPTPAPGSSPAPAAVLRPSGRRPAAGSGPPPGGARWALTLGLPIAGEVTGDDHRGIVDLARAADEGGDGRPRDVGPRRDAAERLDRYALGRLPYPTGRPWLEPLTLLAAIAGATRPRPAGHRGLHRAAPARRPPGQDRRHARPALRRAARARGRERASGARSTTPRASTSTAAPTPSTTRWRRAGRCGGPAPRPSRPRPSRSTASGATRSPTGRVGHRSCSRGRSRPATSSASSPWATGGSRSWEHRRPR